MTNNHQETISILNHLVETCKDGYEGFRSASQAVKNDHLKTVFMQLAEERAQCASKLQAEVARLGGTPEKHGSTAAAMHRGWMGLKAAVTGGDEAAIVAECERGEDASVAEFRKALDKGLDVETEGVIQQVFRTVKDAHDRVRQLELKHHH